MECFTINMCPTHWTSAWISNMKENGWGLHFVFNVLLKQSTAVMPAFFRMSDKKRGEMEREGSWRMGGGKEERWRGCWHALVSNLFESIAQFICFVSTATAEDNQTRRPLDSSYCPPPAHTPLPLSLPPPHLFFHVTCWLKERQGNSRASPNGEMLGREPTSKPCCHGDTVRSRNYTQALRIYSIHTHTLLCTPW